MARTIHDHNYALENVQEYNINVDTREIFLHSYMSDEEEMGVDFRMAVQLQKNVRYLDSMSNEEIVIHMTSCGGDWSYGMAIYDVIMSSRCYITIIGYGNVRSMTSIIIQAADKRIVSPYTEFMIHYGTFGMSADTKTTYANVDWDKYNTKRMIDLYANKCQNGPFFTDNHYRLARIKTFLKNQMDKKGDWYLNAEDAVKYGFVDGILGEKGYELETLLTHK